MINTKQKDVPANNSTEVPEEKNPLNDSKTFREISYVILFIGAVFIINALETGSYRTPWPVAILTALSGVILYGYSRLLKSRDQ